MIPSVDRHVGVNLSFQKESDCTVTLKGCIGDRQFEYSLPVRFDVTTTDIAPVHRLAAKRWIKELSDEENHGWFYQLLFDIILKPEHISGLAYFIHRALQTNLIPPAPNRICHRITLESPRGWWPQESGFREVRGRDGTTISGPGSLSGVPSSRASSCGHPLWWLRLVNSHRFPVEKIKNVWLFLQKIWHRNKKFHIKTNKMRGRMTVLRRV